jgi:hypothetical protein
MNHKLKMMMLIIILILMRYQSGRDHWKRGGKRKDAEEERKLKHVRV